MPVTYDDCLFADRVLERSNTTGLDDFICIGTRLGYRTFLEAFDEDDEIVYLAEHETNGQWEIGKGTVAAEGELTRDEIIVSSEGTDKIDFAEGQKLVRCTMPAELLMQFAGFTLPFLDTQELVKDPADGTKRMRIDSGAVATGTTRVLSMPNKNVDLGLAVLSDGSVAFAADQSMGSHKLTNVTDPTSAQDAATKNYVDALTRGLDWKDSCRAATTANITLSGAQTIDDVSVIAGDRVLVKNQSTASQNGIYVCASGAWSRAGDADASVEVTAGMCLFVSEGSVNGNKQFVLTTDDAITLGSTSLTFTQLGDGNSGGDVVGPASSTDNAVVRFDSTTGKLLRNSGVTISDADKLKGKASYSDTASQTGSGTRTLDLNADNFHLVTLTGTATGALSNVSVGQRFAVRIKQDATGGRAWTWWDGIHWPGDVEPTLVTTANRWDWFGFICTGTGEYGAGEFDGFILGRDYRP